MVERGLFSVSFTAPPTSDAIGENLVLNLLQVSTLVLGNARIFSRNLDTFNSYVPTSLTVNRVEDLISVDKIIVHATSDFSS